MSDFVAEFDSTTGREWPRRDDRGRNEREEAQ